MLLFVEIALSLLARKRGWNKFAAIPLLVALVVGIPFGLLAGIAGVERDLVILIALSLDGVIIVSLIVMCCVGGPFRESNDGKQTPNKNRPSPITRPNPPRRRQVDGYKAMSPKS